MRKVRWILMALALAPYAALAAEPPALPKATHNLLVDATLSGNMADFNKGLRGEPVHVVYDLQRCRFKEWGPWNEYGVGLHKDVGHVPEDKAAYWMAEWAAPVSANLIRLSGAYANQPQRRTGWKIELRRNGKWAVHARGVGGWYNGKQYAWGGANTPPLTFDAFRVSVFSPNARTKLRSIHFRGEDKFSWAVALLPKIDARIIPQSQTIREGTPATFTVKAIAGKIKTWQWDFGDGAKAAGLRATHTFKRPYQHEVTLTFSDGKETATVLHHVNVALPIEARIAPMTGPVMAGKPVEFSAAPSIGKIKNYAWNFGDGDAPRGAKVRHIFTRAGVHNIGLRVTDATHLSKSHIIVRVHTPQTLHVPQIHLDTDPGNGIDDQHALGYALLSQLDVLGVNSVHHGGGQDQLTDSHAKIRKIVTLAVFSAPKAFKAPPLFHGSDRQLYRPEFGGWTVTEPVVTEASNALLASARGASPTNRVWWVAIGACTNLASAIVQAKREGLDLARRVRIVWLGGTPKGIGGQYNGDNDRWAATIIVRSGIETWIITDDLAGKITAGKTADAKLYAAHHLGKHLLKIAPDKGTAPLYDIAPVAAIIDTHRLAGWVKSSRPVSVNVDTLEWTKAPTPSTVRVVTEIDAAAMKSDLLNTLRGKPTQLLGRPPAK
jgi:inosine-uridine nucleoside N-ribohydrolase